MITRALLPRFRAAEFTQFLTNALQILADKGPGTLLVEDQASAVEEALAEVEEEYQRQTLSGITSELAELDKRRDKALKGIRRVVSGYEEHFDPAKLEAAQRITLVLKKYGPGIARLRYQQETGEVRSLVQDLQGDAAVSAALETLGLTDWVAELSSANQEFDDAFVRRAQEMAGGASQLLALRRVAVKKWAELTTHLTARATLTPSELYTRTLAELNSLISDYNTAVTNRTSDAPPVPEPTE
jgi:hypothetical protein